MNLKAVKKVNIGDQVYNQMKDQIMSGVWVPGEDTFGKSAYGSVWSQPGDSAPGDSEIVSSGTSGNQEGEGSYVGQLGLANYFQSAVPAAFLSEDELKEVFEFRMLFECGVAEMAAENATEVQIRKLEKNYKKMLQNLGNLEKYIEIDFEFHCLLGECTHNTLVCQMYKTMEDALVMSIREGTEMIGFEHGRKDHGLILNAVQSHDSQAAREAMRHHIIDHPALAMDGPSETKVDSLMKQI